LLHTDEEIQEIVLACIEGGVPLSRTENIYTAYMRHPDDFVVGVCCGIETHFVYAEWLSSGEIHGRPICHKELITKGADL